MKFIWQNVENPNFNHDDFAVSPGHTPFRRVMIVIFTVLFFPIMLVLYPIAKLVVGSFLMACRAGFSAGERIFTKKRVLPAYYYFQGVRSNIAMRAGRVPHVNNSMRKMLYRLNGMHIGKDVFIGSYGVFDDVYPENVVIEDGVTISFNVTIVAHGPKRNISSDTDKMVIFRRGCYVGARTLIIPGVEIGANATVGAGAVVTKNVPAGAVVAGNPARVLYYKPGYEPQEQ